MRAPPTAPFASGAWARGVLALVLPAAGCLEVPQPKPASEVDVRDVSASSMVLESACSPTGIELCFDAYDNNCNAIIDEGCGLETGVLQFTIAWQEPAVDVDLRVTGPDGSNARREEPNEAGLVKDRDCPGSDNACHGQNVENVYLAEGAPRPGRYRVAVRLEDLRGQKPPIRVRFSARIGQRQFTSVLVFEERSDERTLEFSL